MICDICGGDQFVLQSVLWDRLIDEWGLNEAEVSYINKQQGLNCSACGANLRSRVLARAIMEAVNFIGNFSDFVVDARYAKLRLLEINEAGTLSRFLNQMPGHQLVEYPEYDMTNMNIPSESWDIVVHSDTLEHVADPLQGLRECRRVLREGGSCIFTVPIIVDRLSRSREGLPDSFHGNEEEADSGLLVRTEFGSDVWLLAANAGFRKVSFSHLDFPAGIAIEMLK